MSSSCANSHQFNASISKLTRTNNPTLHIIPSHPTHSVTTSHPNDVDATQPGRRWDDAGACNVKLITPPAFDGQFMLKSGRVGGCTHTHINGCIKFQNTFTFIRYTVLPHSHSFGEGWAGRVTVHQETTWNETHCPRRPGYRGSLFNHRHHCTCNSYVVWMCACAMFADISFCSCSIRPPDRPPKSPRGDRLLGWLETLEHISRNMCCKVLDDIIYFVFKRRLKNESILYYDITKYICLKI